MEPTRNDSIDKLRELIAGIEVAALTTIDGDGALRSRPMATQEMDEEGVLWFFTDGYSPKVQEVLVNPQVCVTYHAPDKQRFVSISGKAELVRDHAVIARYWRPELKAWLPKGIDDPDVGLLRVEIVAAHYWDAPSSKLVRLASFVKAIAKGESVTQTAESKKLTIKHRIASDTVT